MTCLARTSGLPWPHTFPALLPLTTTPRPAHGKGKTNRPSRTWNLLCHQLLFSDHERFATAEKEILVTHKKPLSLSLSTGIPRFPVRVDCLSAVSKTGYGSKMTNPWRKSSERIQKRKRIETPIKKFKIFSKQEKEMMRRRNRSATSILDAPRRKSRKFSERTMEPETRSSSSTANVPRR